MVGTDIAELLLRDHRTVWLPGKSPNEANLIDFTNEAVEQVEEEESGEAQLSFLTDSQAASTLEKDTERFRELLLYGRKKVSDPRWRDMGAGPTLGAERPAGGSRSAETSVHVSALKARMVARPERRWCRGCWLHAASLSRSAGSGLGPAVCGVSG